MSFWFLIGVTAVASFTVGHGIGYDQCFKDKADIEFGVSNIFSKASGGIDETEYKIRERIRGTIKQERPWWCKLI